jgi:hypothetical protein
MPAVILILAILGATGIYALVNMVRVLTQDKLAGSPILHRTFEFIAVIGTPLFFLMLFDFNQVNDCCTDSAFFSPEHRLTIYVLIFLSIWAYFYSSFRNKTAPPLIELLVNCLLGTGLVLSLFIGIHTNDLLLWLPGIPAVLFFFISQMVLNHRLLLTEIAELEISSAHSLNNFFLTILRANVFIKFPLLLILSIPILLFLSLLFYVFGQRPDSVIRAFTETYKHGFSQLDYQCENVQCGGHYLCSVAANGHKQVVKPVRIGKRNGHFIICNRQLLISNAFEELLLEKFPALHRSIRRQYDKVGDMVHRNYNIYSKKWVSDLVYMIMKPAEWAFLLLLYLVDRKPEQRIARQYAPWE